MTPAELFRPHTLDELLDHAPGLLRAGRLSAWERGFVASMIQRGRRRNWQPTERQERELRRLVEVRFYGRPMTAQTATDDPVLIDQDAA